MSDDMIVLLTDFGWSDYAGVMKGIIYTINPNARIVDLCHDIAPQSIIEAAWILKNNYKYFPKGSIFCCVVDPGVGTDRKALSVTTADYRFIAPDNGLLYETLREQTVIETRRIPTPADAGRTFHGRDVFARAAAQISLGSFDGLGDRIDTIRRLDLYRSENEGLVVRIDRFGNIITNLPGRGRDTYTVEIGRRKLRLQFYPDYESAKPDELFLIKGSCGTLEISLKDADANKKLHTKAGTSIKIS